MQCKRIQIIATKVVLPIVESVLNDDELRELRIELGEPEDLATSMARELFHAAGSSSARDKVRIIIVAGPWNEQASFEPCSVEDMFDDDEVATGADLFASSLEDFIAESRFAWGQERHVQFPDPPYID